MRLISGERGKRSAHPAILIVLVFWSASAAGRAGEPTSGAGKIKTDPSAIEFFEKSVRPILVERCQGCHGSTKQKGGCGSIRVKALAGGLTGPAVVPGLPEKSLLIDAINYGELYQMPPKSKLPSEEIAILTRRSISCRILKAGARHTVAYSTTRMCWTWCLSSQPRRTSCSSDSSTSVMFSVSRGETSIKTPSLSHLVTSLRESQYSLSPMQEFPAYRAAS